jgi:hypothetical protein
MSKTRRKTQRKIHPKHKIKRKSFMKHHATKKRHSYTKKNCDYVTTADPRVFGPELWRSLHRIAQNYPQNPSEDTQKHAVAFLEAIPYMIPCSHCGCDFLMYLEEHNLKKVCASKEDLVKFLVDAHNRVSSHLDPKKKQWTVSEANKVYSKERVCIGGKPIWKMCKMEKEPYDIYS